MPVHLGSMPMAVASALREVDLPNRRCGCPQNDPLRRGTHLPDVTLVMAVYAQQADGRRQTGRKNKAHCSCRLPTAYCRLSFLRGQRAHHADIGGATPGSMGMAKISTAKACAFPPLRLVRNGELDEDVMRLILGKRSQPRERRGDFQAQIGSLKTGARALAGDRRTSRRARDG